MALLLAGGLFARAEQGDDPFADTNTPSKPAKAKKNLAAERIHFDVAVTPKEAKRGELVKLTINGIPKPGFHTYPLTLRSPDEDESMLGTLKIKEIPGLKPLWPIQESEPEPEMVEGVGGFWVHAKPFTWSRDILILPDATPGKKVQPFTLKLQVCDTGCVWGEFELQADFIVTDGPAVPLTAELQARLKEPPPPIKVVPIPAGAKSLPSNSQADTPATTSTTAPAEQGLWGFLGTSALAAFFMLCTPCVFPMIPITVSYFLKQSEKEHHNALVTALVYSFTIIVVLSLAVLVLGQVIVALANSPWMNLGLGAVLVFFALSLFGMYDIALPAGMARFTYAREEQGGYVGAIFMALTFTITSFTCTGPFLGPLLVAVKETQVGFTERALGAVVYSSTFAAPFFVLALFPTLMKKLPKSGGWMNAVKVTMGFLELAAALKFLANTDLAWNPGNPALFNYETVLCAWIALSLACGMYLLGLFRMPHDDAPVEHVGVVRMLIASIFFGLAVYMVPALWRVTPQGIVGQGLVAFLPLDTRIAPVTSSGGGQGELTWQRDYQKAWETATRENKLIFIDFTGVTCTNCRYNEKNVFPVPAVHQELAQYVRVQLYTDFVPDSSLTRAESESQATRNSGWQSATFGDITNPLYAIIKPDKNGPFEAGPDGAQKLKGEVLGKPFTGQIRDSQLSDFEKFLSEPLKQQNGVALVEKSRSAKLANPAGNGGE